MTAALRYEWQRIRSIRSTYWITSIAVVAGVGLSFLVAMGMSFAFDSATPPPSAEDVRRMPAAIATQLAALGAPYFVAYLLAMLGVFAWGHEYRHGMIRATLTALNSRTSVWVAKLLVVGAWVLGVGLVILLGSLLSGWLWLHDDGVRFDAGVLAGTVGRALLYILVFAWVAASFTALVRNQTAALVLVFLWPLAVENLVSVVFALVPGLRDHASVTRFLPFSAGSRIVEQMGSARHTFGDPLSALGGFVVFGGVTAAVMTASLLLFRKRDA